MDNPMERPIPEDSLERIHALARDLAYAAVHNLCSASITITRTPGGEDWGGHREALAGKWGAGHPAASLLHAFGYLRAERYLTDTATDYLLTQKAFDLLHTPAASARCFISYNRPESSAFALLLAARLTSIGVDAFLDIQDLKPGDDWHEELKKEVRDREYFVALIGPSTLESPFVREEIKWAWDYGKRSIPIWHNGYHYEGDDQSELMKFLVRNAIIVENENAKAYNNAVVELLNVFGYTPA